MEARDVPGRIAGRAVNHRDAQPAQGENREEQRPVDVEIQTSFEHRYSLRFAFRSGFGGSGRPSCFAKKVSRTWCATCAALPPCTPCSRNTTPAIFGLSRGAKNTNQP